MGEEGEFGSDSTDSFRRLQRTMRSVVLALIVAAANAMEFDGFETKKYLNDEAEATFRRLSETNGALDLNICDACANKKGPNCGTKAISNMVGTIHDDQTTKADCSKGQCSHRDSGKNGYGDALRCGKVITAPAGSTVKLTFTHFNLGTGKNCPKGGCDHLSIYDGASNKAKLLYKGSGHKLPPALTSSGQSLCVRPFSARAPPACHGVDLVALDLELRVAGCSWLSAAASTCHFGRTDITCFSLAGSSTSSRTPATTSSRSRATRPTPDSWRIGAS